MPTKKAINWEVGPHTFAVSNTTKAMHTHAMSTGVVPLETQRLFVKQAVALVRALHLEPMLKIELGVTEKPEPPHVSIAQEPVQSAPASEKKAGIFGR